MESVEQPTDAAYLSPVFPEMASRRHWPTLIAILVSITAIFTNIYATQPIIPTLGAYFHVSPSLSGLSISLVVLGLGVAALIYGPLSDSIGRKPVMVATAAALIIPTLGAVLAPNYAIFLFCRILQGLLIPGTTTVGLAYLQEEFPPHLRGIGTSAYVSATALGGLIGRLQCGLLTNGGDWHIGFGSFVLTTALSVVVMLVWIPSQRQRAHQRITARALLQAYARLGIFWRQKRIVGGAIVGFTMFFGFVSVFTYLPYRVQQPPFNLSSGATSLLYLVYFVGFLVTPWSGRLSDRIGRRAVIALALGSMSIGILLTLLPTLVGIISGLLLLNIGLLAAHAAATAFVSENTTEGKGSAASFYLVFYYFGGAIGPYICGLAWESVGWIGVVGACFATVILAFISDLVLCA